MYKRKRKEKKKKEKDLIYERKRNGDIILEITYFPHWGTVVEELRNGARTNCPQLTFTERLLLATKTKQNKNGGQSLPVILFL